MERCRLNLRIVDEGCPENEQHQHLESNKDSYRGMFCTRSQLTFFPKTTSLAAEGTYCITNSVKARITKDLALEFELGELRFAGKFEDEGRRPLPINLHTFDNATFAVISWNARKIYVPPLPRLDIALTWACRICLGMERA
jgi:hypothetical protein